MEIDENEEDQQDWERHVKELKEEQKTDGKEESSVNNDKFIVDEGTDVDGETKRKKKKNNIRRLSVKDSGYEDQDDAAI